MSARNGGYVNYYAGIGWNGGVPIMTGFGSTFHGDMNVIFGQPGNTASLEIPQKSNFGTISEWEPSALYDWSQSENFLAEIGSGIVDGFAVTLQAPFLSDQTRHINGDFVRGYDRINALGTSASWIIPFGPKGAAKGVQTTLHGAERVAGTAATRGGILSIQGINATKTLGRAFTQKDGATVFLHEISPGRFNAVVQGHKGIITTMENWSQKSINRIAKNYGWKLE